MAKTKLFKMNHAYRIFLLLVSVCLFGNVRSAAMNDENSKPDVMDIKYFMVWDNAGGCVSFPISEHPRVIPDVVEATVKCVTDKEVISFSIYDVHKYTLEADESGKTFIEKVSDDKGKFNRNANTLYFNNFKPGTKVAVYTIDGTLISSYKIDDNGCLSFSVDNLGKGIYLINTSNVTYKIIKK